MTDRIEIIMMRLFTHNFLSRFRWYRKRVGGFWCHSKVMGWEQKNNIRAQRDLDLYKTHPELYRRGKDIEDYRPVDERNKLDKQEILP